MTGGGGGGGGNVEAPPQQQYQAPYDSQQQPQVCQYELRQFLDCAQNQTDISLCSGFNEALRQCKISNGKLLSVTGKVFVTPQIAFTCVITRAELVAPVSEY